MPVQHGSDILLKSMRRGLGSDGIRSRIDMLRDINPEIAIRTSIIVGFPGETARDFEETLSLVRTVGYHSMFSFKYSERPNTLATQRFPDDVSAADKTSRIIDDPVNGTTNPKAIPGATIEYCIVVSNASGAATGTNIDVNDELPADVS